jgi:acyl-CoA synthetase (AMP-forming)/AMP-acid ligase II
MEHRTLWSLLEVRAEQQPDRELVVHPNGVLTRAEAAERCGRVAGGLRALGVTAGSRVAVFAGNRLEHIELTYALNLLGATYVPINPDYRGALLTNALTTAQPIVTIVDAECFPWLEPHRDDAGLLVALDPTLRDVPGITAVYGELLRHERPPTTTEPFGESVLPRGGNGQCPRPRGPRHRSNALVLCVLPRQSVREHDASVIAE